MSLSDASRRLEEKRMDMNNKTSPVTNAVNGMNSGAGSAKSAVSGIVSNAGETFNQISSLGSGFTGLKDTIGNAFGGSNDVAANPVPANGSGGDAPGVRAGGFATRPDATLPSLDPIKRDVSKPFEASNAESEGMMEYFGFSKVGAGLSSGFDSIVGVYDDVTSATAPYVQRIESTMDMVGSIASLPDKVLNQFSNIMASAVAVENGYKAVVDGVTHSFNSLADLGDYMGINKFISDYADVDREQETLDVDALRALIMAMGQTMIAVGQQEKLEEVIARIPDASVREAIYDDLIILSAQLGSVQGAEYYQAKLSPGHGSLVANQVISNMLANLEVDAKEGFKSVGQRLLALFDSIKPAWNIDAASQRIELFFYTLCNGNALSALLTTTHRPLAVAGGNVKSLMPTEQVERFFPVKVSV